MAIRIIDGVRRDLGGFQVARVLPAVGVKAIGPLVFFDHMGPVDFAPGAGLAVRAHPHIGLATITYLFEGAILHRDSIGSLQEVRPGEVNWMSAGRGVVHSERSPENLTAAGHRLHGLQLWVAEAEHDEDSAPAFHHQPIDALPEAARDGVLVRLLIGSAFGLRAPTQHGLPMFYAHLTMQAKTRFVLPAEYAERGIYAVDTAISVDDKTLKAGSMAVIDGAQPVVVGAKDAATVMLIGGAALPSARYLEWNFVSSSKDLIDQAKDSWRHYPNPQFPAVPGETEWIPLPG